VENVEAVLQELRDQGAGVLDALKQVRRRCGVDLGVAKRALAEHPAWSEARAGLVQSGELADEVAGTLPTTSTKS
jgi:hypothetical protein